MATEPPQLVAAREHLAKAEAGYRTALGLRHLEDGLGLLDEVVLEKGSSHRELARKLGTTYAAKIYGAIGAQLASERGVPEPELEHLFKVILAFDHGDWQLPASAREIKIAIARRLIDRYYEGHTAEEKEKALQELAKLAGKTMGR